MTGADSQANAQLVTRFYTAFASLDSDTMGACYAADAQFDDEVFTLRGGVEVAAMWAMLCSTTKEKARDAWSLQFSAVSADDRQGRAHWEAHYRFGATGRLVHNIIDAEFTFRDGLIATQRDRFDFWAWSRQALGAPGVVLGWTPLLRNKVRKLAASNLKAYRARSRSA